MGRTIKDEIDLPEASEKKARANEIAVVTVLGDAVLRYNKASDEKKKAEAAMKELRPDLLSAGLSYIFKANDGVSDDARVQSVRLKCGPIDGGSVDADEEPNELCTFTLVDKTTKLDKAKIDEFIPTLRRTDGKQADANDYVSWSVAAEFDTDIFANKEGKWDQSRYDMVLAALQVVADKLKVPNPLSCAKELAVKPEFFHLRYKHFTPSQNLKLNKVIPCAANLEAVRAASKT